MTKPITLRGVILMSIAVFLPAAAQAQPFVDDFEDGSISDGRPVSWVPYIEPWAQEQTVEVVEGDLFLAPSATALPAPIPGWDPNYVEAGLLVDGRLFQDVSVHTQVRVSGDGQGLLYVAGRDTWNNDPSSLGVNVFASMGVDDQGTSWLDLGGNTGSGSMSSMRRNTSLNFHDTDIHLQLDIIGDRANLFAWADGETKPETPFLNRRLAASQMVAGQVSLGYGQLRPSVHPTNQMNTASFRFVDVVPEPSTAFLAAMGLALLACRQRK